jgi:hypothetical protein
LRKKYKFFFIPKISFNIAKHLNQTTMENHTHYGPFTKQGAKYWYCFYSAEAVIGSIEWPRAKRLMDFYSLYL